MMDENDICPNCFGTKQTVDVANDIIIPCNLCDEEGLVTDEVAQIFYLEEESEDYV